LSTPLCLRRLTLKTTECDVVRAGVSYSSKLRVAYADQTSENHAQDFQFISRGYCAANDGDSLWML